MSNVITTSKLSFNRNDRTFVVDETTLQENGISEGELPREGHGFVLLNQRTGVEESFNFEGDTSKGKLYRGKNREDVGLLVVSNN